MVPIRTMVAAVPGPFSRLPSDSSGNSMGLYYPLLGRFQPVASGHLSGSQAQASGELPTDSAVQQHNIVDPARDGKLNIQRFN